MIHDNLLLIIILLLVVSLLSMLSEKLRIPYPIFLVICGIMIGVIPDSFEIVLQPDLVFLIFLPPLLFSAAWNTSWKEFLKYRRAIGLLAIGLVIFTSFTVAVVSNLLIPGFTLALGFLLGGIISPPDVISATSILQRLKMPRRIISILEGESLVNDAASLIVFRFALAAIITSQFVLWEAGANYLLVAVAGIGTGLAIAFGIYSIHRFLPTTPSIDTAITLMAPYLMFIAAEHFHFSGVLSVVSGGLFLSSQSTKIFSYNTRIQASSVWETLVFVMNGAVFILIGLQLPMILKNLEEGSIFMAIYYGIIISIVTILVRIIWVYPATYLPRLLFKSIREKEPYPSWKGVFIVAWSGMRGVVSLAAALSIPLYLAPGIAFPHRNLILFISFIVILFTLVFQGLTLPFLIRKLDIEVKDNDHEHELKIQMNLVKAVLDYINTRYAHETESNHSFRMLKERYEHLLKSQKKMLSGTDHNPDSIPAYSQALLELVDVRRKALEEMRVENIYPDDAIRNIEREIDHEEARLRVKEK